MKKKRVGNSDLEVAPLAFGGNVFGWTTDEATSFEILDRFIEGGFNLIDTADVYSFWTGKPGISETIIGKWLKKTGKRNQVILATKVGMEMAPGKLGLSRAHIISSIEGSLARLATDHIDLYQAHKDDPNIPLEETLEAFARLVEQGKVRYIGASNYSAERLEQALEVSHEKNFPSFKTLQPNYNLYDREEFEKELEAVCIERHVGVISYFSLASGFLTGKYRSKEDLGQSARSSRVEPYLNDRGHRILKALDEVAKRENCTQAQASLAWLMAKPAITAPIASATSTKQLDDLMGAARLRLDAESIAELDRASAWR